MLTLYFRESGSGPVHSVQGVVLRVVAPLQNGTARATKPFRDAWNWTGDLFSAKSENAKLQKEVEQLRAGVANELTTQDENAQMRDLLALQRDKIFPAGVHLVTARVVARSTTAWYSPVTIAGRRPGHHLGQRHRRRHAAVPRQERARQGGPVRRDLRSPGLRLRARHPHRPDRERRQPGSRAVPEHLAGPVRRLPQARPGPGGCAMRLARTPADNQQREWPSSGEIARLVVTLVVATLLQTTVAPNIRILGANPDFALIIVVCVALLKGSEIGAVFGFATGTLVAIALMEPLGLSAFVFVLAGFFAGRYAETADLSAGYAPLVSAFAATLLADVLLAMAQFLLERQAPLGFFLGRVLIPSLILNTLLAAPLYLVVRLWLRGGGGLRAARAR